MTWLGLVGGPLLLIGNVGVLFDCVGAQPARRASWSLPEFLWELSLGIYAAVWGFKASSPILRDDRRTVTQTA